MFSFYCELYDSERICINMYFVLLASRGSHLNESSCKLFVLTLNSQFCFDTAVVGGQASGHALVAYCASCRYNDGRSKKKQLALSADLLWIAVVPLLYFLDMENNHPLLLYVDVYSSFMALC